MRLGPTERRPAEYQPVNICASHFRFCSIWRLVWLQRKEACHKEEKQRKNSWRCGLRESKLRCLRMRKYWFCSPQFARLVTGDYDLYHVDCAKNTRGAKCSN
jgi:hypothetical protein